MRRPNRLLRKVDRILLVIVSGAVGLQAIIPGWQVMTDGSVYGFKLPTNWLTSNWPFHDYFVAGLLLLVVIGGGCIATAVINIVNRRLGAPVALVMGFVLVGWIAGELIFMTETMIMTWIILGSGFALIALSAPYAVGEMSAFASHRRRSATA